MKFILQYPEVTGLDRDMLDCGDVGEMAALAEAAGFDGISFTEHPAPGANWLTHGGHQTLDPFIALAFAAAATERLRLLTYLSVVPYRNPLLLAKSAASLDRLSNGRFTLGIGTGYHKTEFFALGVDFDERNDVFDEALDVLPRAWSGEPFSYAGRHFEARNVVQRPRPTQQPIPIWIGGNSQRSRRRVAASARGLDADGRPARARGDDAHTASRIGRHTRGLGRGREGPGRRGGPRHSTSSRSTRTPRSASTPAAMPAGTAMRSPPTTPRGSRGVVVGASHPTPEQHRAFIETFGTTYLTETGLGGGA